MSPCIVPVLVSTYSASATLYSAIVTLYSTSANLYGANIALDTSKVGRLEHLPSQLRGRHTHLPRGR